MFAPSTIMSIAMKSHNAEKLYFNMDNRKVEIIKSGQNTSIEAPQELIEVFENNLHDIRLEHVSYGVNTRNKPVQIYDNTIEIDLT